MDRFGELAESGGEATADDEVLWRRVERVVSRVAEANGEDFDGQFFVDKAGDHVFSVEFDPEGISILIPYGFDQGVDYVLGRVEALVREVEAETGLVAFDPQADKPFLAGGLRQASRNISGARRSLYGDERPRWPRRILQVAMSFLIAWIVVWVASKIFGFELSTQVLLVWLGAALTYERLGSRSRFR